MATLSGNKIKDTYQSLVKFSDNGNITTSAKQLTDGFGNNSPMYVSTTQVGIGVTPESGLNLHVYGDAKIGSNLTVIGNLVVEGSTTTVGTDTLTVKDPLIVLANNNTSTDAVDIGFYGKYTPSGTTLYSGLFREALTGKYRLFKDLQEEPTTTVNTSGTGYAVASLIANLEGNVTGNLIGSVTGGTFSGTLLSNVAATTQSAGDNSTKVATTAYVDNQVGLYDTLSEVLANGNTSGANDIIMADSQKVNYGTDSDLQIYHDGTDSYIKNDTGNLIIEQTTDDADIIFKNDNGSGDTIEYFRIDGSESRVVYGRSIHMADNVSIFLGNDDDGLIRYDSTANKILYTGTSQFSGNVDFANNVTIPETPTADTHAASKGYVDAAVEGQDTLAEILAIGNTTGGTDIAITAGDKITNFTSTGIDDNATSTVLTIDNTNRALFSGDVSLQANLIGNTNATGDLTILGSLFVGDYGVNDDPDYLYADNNIVRIGYYSNAKQFEVNNSDFKVTATHKVGIGTNDPQTLLEVSNENSLLDPVIRLNNVDSSLSDGQNLGSIEFYNDHTSSTTANIGVFHSTDGTIVKEMKFNLGSSGDILTLDANEINATKRFTITGSGSTPRVTLANNVGEGGLTYSLRSTDGGIFGIYKGSTDVLTIDSNGDVGIGTDSAQTKLHLQDEDNALFFTLESSNTTTHKNVAIKYQNYSTGTDFWWTGMDGSGDNMNNFVFNYSQNFDSTVLTLQPNGKVGIGINDPDRILHINSSNVQIAALIESTSTTSTQLNFKNGSTTNNGGFIKTTGDNIILTANNTSATHLVVASGGNVGIGTDSPSTKLQVKDSQDSSFDSGISVIRSASSQTGYINMVGGAFNFNAPSGVPIRFRDGGTANVTIDSSGDVGIGTTSPDAKLHIKSPANARAIKLQNLQNNSASYILWLDELGAEKCFIGSGTSAGGDADELVFGTDSSERMRIDSSGDVGIGTTSPKTSLDIFEDADIWHLMVGGGTKKLLIGGQGTNGITIQGGAASTPNNAAVTTPYNISLQRDGGNVGIGTTSPDYLLHLEKSGTIMAQLKATDSNQAYMKFVNSTTGDGAFTDGLLFGLDTDESAVLWNYEATALRFATSGTERMRIKSGGNVGIGTDDPDSKLTINSGATNVAMNVVSTDGSATIAFADNNTTAYNYNQIGAIGNDLKFVTSTSERMRITSGGDVLINLTSPITSSSNTSIGTTLSDTYSWFASNDSLYIQRPNGTNGTAISFYRANVFTGNISLSGSATAYNTSSDYRLKENVVEMTGALDRVSQLKPSRFNFIADADKTVDGFLAHEVQDIVPEAITGEKDAVDEEGNAIYQGIDQSKLVPLLVGAIQELKAEIELLKTQINN